MEVIDALDPLGLNDRHAIDEIDSLDQHPIQEHGVMRRYPQVAARAIHIERACLDADRQHVRAARETPRVAAPPDPSDWPRGAVSGDDAVADRQRSTSTSPRSVRIKVPAQ